jgi:hypothetical protein
VLLLVVCLIWGAAIVADSPQFSASVIELSERPLIGTMLTVQTCLGFLLTLTTIHLMDRDDSPNRSDREIANRILVGVDEVSADKSPMDPLQANTLPSIISVSPLINPPSGHTAPRCHHAFHWTSFSPPLTVGVCFGSI